MDPKWRLEASSKSQVKPKWHLEATLKGQVESKLRLEASLKHQVESKLRLEVILKGQVESKLRLEGTWTTFKYVLEATCRPYRAQLGPSYVSALQEVPRSAGLLGKTLV